MGVAQGWLISKGVDDVNSVPYSAIAYTRYAAQLRAYTKFFRKKDIFVIDFEDLKNRPEIVLKKIYTFLELEQYRVEKEKISDMAEPVFNIITEDIKKQHVPQQVQPSTVQKH